MTLACGFKLDVWNHWRPFLKARAVLNERLVVACVCNTSTFTTDELQQHVSRVLVILWRACGASIDVGTEDLSTWHRFHGDLRVPFLPSRTKKGVSDDYCQPPVWGFLGIRHVPLSSFKRSHILQSVSRALFSFSTICTKQKDKHGQRFVQSKVKSIALHAEYNM